MFKLIIGDYSILTEKKKIKKTIVKKLKEYHNILAKYSKEIISEYSRINSDIKL